MKKKHEKCFIIENFINDNQNRESSRIKLCVFTLQQGWLLQGLPFHLHLSLEIMGPLLRFSDVSLIQQNFIEGLLCVKYCTRRLDLRANNTRSWFSRPEHPSIDK